MLCDAVLWFVPVCNFVWDLSVPMPVCGRQVVTTDDEDSGDEEAQVTPPLP